VPRPHRDADTPATAKLKGFKVLSLAAITCAMMIAACGVSVHLGGAARPSLASAELKVSECMRSHRVPNFPDPSGGGGFNLNGTGVNMQPPAFESAQQTCFKLLPGGGPGAHPVQAMAQALKVSECMRRHGVSGFPDPTLKPPSNPNRAEYSIVDDRDGAVLAVPSTINPSSPVFKQAATACGFD
jgi:hypothetical protein